MLVFAFLFLIFGFVVLTVKRPAERLSASALYLADNRVVATVLFIISGCLFVLGYSEMRTVVR